MVEFDPLQAQALAAARVRLGDKAYALHFPDFKSKPYRVGVDNGKTRTSRGRGDSWAEALQSIDRPAPHEPVDEVWVADCVAKSVKHRVPPPPPVDPFAGEKFRLVNRESGSGDQTPRSIPPCPVME